MRITNPHNLPEAYVRAVSVQRIAQVGRISVTELLKPPQQRALELQYVDDIEVTADSQIDLFFGNAVHEYLAKFAGPDTLAEERMQVVIDGWTVHGTPDAAEWLEATDGVLTDWKTTRVRALRYDREEWRQQVNLYAHLLRLNGMPVAQLQVKAFLKDWDRAGAKDDGYPTSPIVHVPVPMWPEQQAHDFLMQRLRLHRQGARGYYGPCTPDERWQHTSYAVTKQGNQRPTRVFDTREDAETFAAASTEAPRNWRDWYVIDERVSDPIRCKSFCRVAQFCDQWAEDRRTEQQRDFNAAVGVATIGDPVDLEAYVRSKGPKAMRGAE